jgi:diacylglycerol kinase family enzyme
VLSLRRRLLAAAALVALLAALAVAVLALRGDVLALLVGFALIVVTCVAAWIAVTRRGAPRSIGTLGAIAAAVGIVIVMLSGEQHGLAFLGVVALLGLSTVASRSALGRDPAALRATAVPGVPVRPAIRGVLIMNPRSGGGKAERFGLADEARRRGIDPVVLGPGDDLLDLAQRAIDGGADVIGMAGGDGSQALVASLAIRHDVAFVCVPAGTRNHFALDLGLDRDDVVGALDAFGAARERRVDLATVNDRVFVNNASLGVYAKVVQSPAYRDAKRQTALDMLPDLLGPDADGFDLRFVGQDGRVCDSAPLILVSNNRYVLTRMSGFGTRPQLDGGTLGVAAIEVGSAADVAQLVAAESVGRITSYRGLHDWTTAEFRVDSDAPVEIGVDGEALTMDPPLEFRSLPGALRVRIPGHAPGHSPAALAPPSLWWTVTALLGVLAGRAPAGHQPAGAPGSGGIAASADSSVG